MRLKITVPRVVLLSRLHFCMKLTPSKRMAQKRLSKLCLACVLVGFCISLDYAKHLLTSGSISCILLGEEGESSLEPL